MVIETARLDYSDQFDYILSSEHGPAGGDEINLNLGTDIVKNFGWPISSYGVHYSLQDSRTDAHGGDSERVIKSAPIYNLTLTMAILNQLNIMKIQLFLR